MKIAMRTLQFLAVLLSLWQHGPRPQRHRMPLRYPSSMAGVRPGRTTDDHLTKLYGKGYFTDREGHLGGRYYTDVRHSMTLHVIIGVDSIADTVEIKPGVHLPKGAGSAGLAASTTSTFVPARVRVDGFKLGDPSKPILARYGKPSQDLKNGSRREIIYMTDIDSTRDVLYYEAHFVFKGGKLVSVRLYNGE